MCFFLTHLHVWIFCILLTSHLRSLVIFYQRRKPFPTWGVWPNVLFLWFCSLWSITCWVPWPLTGTWPSAIPYTTTAECPVPFASALSLPPTSGYYGGHNAGTIDLSLILLWTQHHQPFLLCWPTPPDAHRIRHLQKAGCSVCVWGLTSPFHPYILLIILISYTFIFTTIMRIPSSKGQCKAFSTRGSHLIAVAMFFGSLFRMYLRPAPEQSVEQGKIVAVVCIFVSLMLNLFIYSLRKKDVKQALRTGFRRNFGTMEKRCILTVSQWKKTKTCQKQWKSNPGWLYLSAILWSNTNMDYICTVSDQVRILMAAMKRTVVWRWWQVGNTTAEVSCL